MSSPLLDTASTAAAAFLQQEPKGELFGDLVGTAVISSVFISLLLAGELWRRWGGAPAEWTRKLVHLGGGLACLLFPFLIERLWLVAILAAALSSIFLASSRWGLLPSLHGIQRSSHGAELYPLSVILLLFIVGDQTWLYVAAILVLAVADAFAALIGTRYGVIRYQVNDSEKTLEGSLVFFTIAFQAIFLPTLLMTDLPRPVCVLASVLVAVLVTFFEAISLRGSDNIFVPLAVAVILESLTRQSFAEIVYQNMSLLGICLAIAFLVWRLPYFNPGSAMALILYAYGAWSLGSWHWALPVFVGMVLYLIVWARVDEKSKAPPIRVQTTVRALLAPFLFVALAAGTGERELFFLPYLAASAAVLAFSLADPLHRARLFRGFSLRRRSDQGRTGVILLVLIPIATLAVTLPARLALPGIVSTSTFLWIPLILGPVFWLVLQREWKQNGGPLAEWSAPRFLGTWSVAVIMTAL